MCVCFALSIIYDCDTTSTFILFNFVYPFSLSIYVRERMFFCVWLCVCVSLSFCLSVSVGVCVWVHILKIFILFDENKIFEHLNSHHFPSSSLFVLISFTLIRLFVSPHLQYPPAFSIWDCLLKHQERGASSMKENMKENKSIKIGQIIVNVCVCVLCRKIEPWNQVAIPSTSTHKIHHSLYPSYQNLDTLIDRTNERTMFRQFDNMQYQSFESLMVRCLSICGMVEYSICSFQIWTWQAIV